MNFTRNFVLLLLLYILQYVGVRVIAAPANWNLVPAAAINPLEGSIQPESLKILSRVKRVRRAAQFNEPPLVDRPYDVNTRSKERFPVWNDADGEYRATCNNCNS